MSTIKARQILLDIELRRCIAPKLLLKKDGMRTGSHSKSLDCQDTQACLRYASWASTHGR